MPFTNLDSVPWRGDRHGLGFLTIAAFARSVRRQPSSGKNGSGLNVNACSEERASLKARQPSAQEITGLVADSAAARSIRAHIAEMKQRIAGKPSAPHEPFADSTPVTAISPDLCRPSTTPRAALMRLFFGQRLTGMSTVWPTSSNFQAQSRTEADAFFQQLPLASQQEYGSPERVVATLSTGRQFSRGRRGCHL